MAISETITNTVLKVIQSYWSRDLRLSTLLYRHSASSCWICVPSVAFTSDGLRRWNHCRDGRCKSFVMTVITKCSWYWPRSIHWKIDEKTWQHGF